MVLTQLVQISLAIILWGELIVSPRSMTNIADPPRDIFILAGQSNMAGRGGVSHGKWDGFVPPESQSNPKIFRLDGSGSWVPANEPLHVDIDTGKGKTCGVGPGMAFANGVLSLGGSKFEDIRLVPCAMGGTKISEWAKGTTLYNRMVDRANVAIGGGGKIRAVLWYQGESDTVSIEDAKAYKGRMEQFIADVRSDLKDPSLLFIQVALASGEGKYMDTVREAQLGIKLPNVKCVDAKGLRLEPDHLHLTTMSQVRVGLMLARAFLGTSAKSDGSHKMSVSDSSSFVVS